MGLAGAFSVRPGRCVNSWKESLPSPNLIIDYAAARGRGDPISTATTESTVQRLLHRRMGANHQMRWSPRGAHRMPKVRIAVMNGTFAADHAAAEPYARRPFRPAV